MGFYVLYFSVPVVCDVLVLIVIVITKHRRIKLTERPSQGASNFSGAAVTLLVVRHVHLAAPLCNLAL